MQTKSYFAHTIEEAMEMARREMGPDALLIDSKEAPPEAWHLGRHETLFAFPKQEPAPAAEEHPIRPDGLPEALQRELAAFRSQMADMRRVLTRLSVTTPTAGMSPELEHASEALIQSGLDPTLTREIIEAAAELSRPTATNNAPVDRQAWKEALASELERRVATDSCLDRLPDRPRIVALVGPPGSGKTTSLVKLAVRRGLLARRPVQLFSVDNYRIGGADQLRAFAAILGVGFQALESPAGLDAAIAEASGKDLIFIDSPGYSTSTWEESAQLRSWLAAHPYADTHLVLPASMGAADLRRIIDRYRAFSPSKLLFTKVDETGTLGPLVSECVRTGIPLSFLGTGQAIPEDFEPAVGSALARGVLNAIQEPVRSAAA